MYSLSERLSPNFTLRELVRSQTASRQGIDNSPDEAQYNALYLLSNNILQPVRDDLGPTNVSSGLRVLELNRAIGSSDTSQHPKGEAADFETLSVDNLSLAQWIRDNLDYDQLILEFFDPDDPRSGWVHCSYAQVNRKRVMTAQRIDGKTVYTVGLPE